MGEHARDAPDIERITEAESLRFHTSGAGQKRLPCERVHPFGDDAQAERLRKGNDCLHDRTRVRCADALCERTVKLDAVNTNLSPLVHVGTSSPQSIHTI